MPTNDFLPFGSAAGANVMSQSDYAALAARANGFSSGTASSAQLNKAWRQSSVMSAVLAQFIADKSGANVLDDGNISTIQNNLSLAISNAVAQGMPAATTTVVGAARIATQTEVDNSNGANLIVTPVTLGQKFTTYFVQATETVLGVLRIATTAQVTAGADDTRAITPLKLAQRLSAAIVAATTTVAGIARIATQTEVNNSNGTNTIVTPATLGSFLTGYIVQATTTVSGIAKTATQALVNAGVDVATTVTPATLRFGVISSLTLQGYVVFPSWLGGFAIQWGSVASAGTVTFPTAFTAAFIALASSNVNGNYTSTGSLTTTSVVLSNSGNQAMTWLAFGRV